MTATYQEKKWNLKCQMKDRYLKNKMKKIGQSCTCPVCKSKFFKKTKAQAFCGSRYDTTCKDAYWNFIRFGTVPDILFGYFKVLDRTEEQKKKDMEMMFGSSEATKEENKMVEELVPDEMLAESEELGNEEKEESKTDDFNDVVPVEGEVPFAEYSIPEDDYFI